jgi:hypothetical protein
LVSPAPFIFIFSPQSLKVSRPGSLEPKRKFGPTCCEGLERRDIEHEVDEQRSTPGEGLVRERVLSRTIWGFTEEVVRGVEKVIRDEVETLISFQEQLKDGEKEVKETQKLSDHTFVHNVILLIKAGTDGGTQFSKIGGEAAVRVVAAKDLKGSSGFGS